MTRRVVMMSLEPMMTKVCARLCTLLVTDVHWSPEHVPLRRSFNAPYFRITSDDDEDDNGDDSNEESPEAASRPRLSAKRSIG